MTDPTLFERQRRLLRVRHPHLEPLLDASSNDHLQLRPSRSGAPTLQFVSNPPFAIHSQYDPMREARQLLGGNPLPIDRPLAIVGPALGYAALAWNELDQRPIPLLLFEPDPAAFRLALEHVDLGELIANPSVHWLIGPISSAMGEELLALGDALADGIEVITPATTERRAPGYYESVRRLLEQVGRHADIARSTKVRQGERTIENLLGNLARYAASPSWRHAKDSARGCPAIIVSAGPSLMKNRHLLPALAPRALLIAVGTAFKQLRALGVEPDVVCQIDHSDLCLRHFDNVGDVGRTVLVADPSASPIVLDRWPGAIAFLHDDLAQAMLAREEPRLPSLPKATTVAHAAYHVAHFLGCDPIILVGQDLAFTDGLYYSAGAGIHELWRPELNRFHSVETKEWERIARRPQELVELAGVHGETALSDRQMASYLAQFERDFALSNRTVIDATEGGAKKNGTISLTLADVARTRIPDRLITWRFPEPTSSPTDRRNLDALFARLARELRALESLLDAMRALGRQCLASDDQRERSRLLSELDQLAGQVQPRLNVAYRLSSAIDGSVEVERDRRTRQIEAIARDEARRLRLSLERDQHYLRGLATSARRLAERFESLTENSIAISKNEIAR